MKIILKVSLGENICESICESIFQIHACENVCESLPGVKIFVKSSNFQHDRMKSRVRGAVKCDVEDVVAPSLPPV